MDIICFYTFILMRTLLTFSSNYLFSQDAIEHDSFFEKYVVKHGNPEEEYEKCDVKIESNVRLNFFLIFTLFLFKFYYFIQYYIIFRFVNITEKIKQIIKTYRTAAQEHFYFETQACLVIPKENDEIELYCSAQHLTELQRTVIHQKFILIKKL